MTLPKPNPTKPPRTGPIPAPVATSPPKLDKNLHDKVLIVDFGSQVTQLIARRVREEKVYCEIVPYQKAEAAFREMKPKAVILSGGPASVLDKDAPLAPKAIYDAGVPVLGICYGEQAMAAQLGGKVEGGHHREFGRAEVEVVADSPIFEGVWKKGEKYPVWMSHGDRVTKLPEGFKVLGISPNAPISIIGDDARKFYATQFHLEVMHTPHGAALLRNFVRKVAGLAGDWTMRAFKDEAIEKIRKQVGKGRVICGLSGGVDSAVAAVLIHEAIGEQLTCVFVDHGLLRLGRGAEGRRRCSATATIFRWCTWTTARSSSRRSPASRTPSRSARPSANCSSTCSTPRRRKSAAPTSWRRARSTRT